MIPGFFTTHYILCFPMMGLISIAHIKMCRLHKDCNSSHTVYCLASTGDYVSWRKNILCIVRCHEVHNLCLLYIFDKQHLNCVSPEELLVSSILSPGFTQNDNVCFEHALRSPKHWFLWKNNILTTLGTSRFSVQLHKNAHHWPEVSKVDILRDSIQRQSLTPDAWNQNWRTHSCSIQLGPNNCSILHLIKWEIQKLCFPF